MLHNTIKLAIWLYLFSFMSFTSCTSLQQKLPPAYPSENSLDLAEMINTFPDSKPEDFALCSTDFDEDLVFEKALTCFNKHVPKENQLNRAIISNRPKCILLKSTSDDVKRLKHFNVLEKIFVRMGITEKGTFGVDIQTLEILGLYSLLTNNIYLVENVDSQKIYQHELIHWFLHNAQLENSNEHAHPIWKQCSEPNYTPSKYSMFINWFRRLGELFQ